MQILFKDINFDGINSELFNNLENEYGEKVLDISLKINIKQEIIGDFNNRIVNPSNINDIIRLCDYLLLENTDKFILQNSVPTYDLYVLNDKHSNNFELPEFMVRGLDLNIYSVDDRFNDEDDEDESKVPKDIVDIIKYDILQWFKFVFKNIDKNEYTICNICSNYGSLNCVKYAHENGCSWGKSICSIAALNGHLDYFKYVHENDCYRNRITCSFAAGDGHLECLKYAHENGCPWDEKKETKR